MCFCATNRLSTYHEKVRSVSACVCMHVCCLCALRCVAELCVLTCADPPVDACGSDRRDPHIKTHSYSCGIGVSHQWRHTNKTHTHTNTLLKYHTRLYLHVYLQVIGAVVYGAVEYRDECFSSVSVMISVHIENTKKTHIT